MSATTVTIRRIDPLSTLKVAALVNVVLFLIWMVAVALLYLIMGGVGIWNSINGMVGDLEGSTIGAGTVLLAAGLVGLVNVVLISALAVIGALVYNAVAALIGGLELSLGGLDTPVAEAAE